MMNHRNAPPSPISLPGASDWPATKTNARFQPFAVRTTSLDAQSPLQIDFTKPGRGQLMSPPHSGGANGMMRGALNGYKPSTSAPRGYAGGPSPPPSAGRSGNTSHLRSDSTRSGFSMRDDGTWEATLAEHYGAFETFLSDGRGGRPRKPPQAVNKARDKLLRLTLGQFLELSTDVYDELNRRMDISAGRPAPEKLPEDIKYHEKRNEARGKLKFLSSPRFRDLAFDVFIELERRFPHFVPADTSVNNRGRTPSTGTAGGNPFPPPLTPGRLRRPSNGSMVSNFDRPQPKVLGTNTIVPNKSTMVEEDDDDDDDDDEDDVVDGEEEGDDSEDREPFGLDRSGSVPVGGRAADKYEREIRDLQREVDQLQAELKRKTDELDQALENQRSASSQASLEKNQWYDARRELETKLADALDDRDRLEREIRDVKDQVNSRNNREAADRELLEENEQLRAEIEEQQRVTEEVRTQTRQTLREMKELVEECKRTWDRQNELEATIERLENEATEWKNRYAKAKAQMHDLRASTNGLPASREQNVSKYVRDNGFIAADGLVKDFHVTKFQMAIDDLARIARSEDGPPKVIEYMKVVVVSVRRIAKDVDQAPADKVDVSARTKIKSRISTTANYFITAAKNFALSGGMTPVALLDAAITNLVSAILELLRFAKIRPTPDNELEEDEEGTTIDSSAMFSPNSNVSAAMSGSRPLAAPAATTIPGSLNTAGSLGPPLGAPPPVRGLRGSVESSTYSAASSPRRPSVEGRYPPPLRLATFNGDGAKYNNNYNGAETAPAPLASRNNAQAPRSVPAGQNQSSISSELLAGQLVAVQDNIQKLVQTIRDPNTGIQRINDTIDGIVEVMGRVVRTVQHETKCGPAVDDALYGLQQLQGRLLEAGDAGEKLAATGKHSNDQDWNSWKNTLPPIAFEVARQMKDLAQQVDAADEFA